jgi:hypothetical protein
LYDRKIEAAKRIAIAGHAPFTIISFNPSTAYMAFAIFRALASGRLLSWNCRGKFNMCRNVEAPICVQTDAVMFESMYAVTYLTTMAKAAHSDIKAKLIKATRIESAVGGPAFIQSTKRPASQGTPLSEDVIVITNSNNMKYGKKNLRQYARMTFRIWLIDLVEESYRMPVPSLRIGYKCD